MSDEIAFEETAREHGRQGVSVVRTRLILRGSAAGHVDVEFDGSDAAYLEDLFVEPELRKAGYGSRLLERAMLLAERHSCNVVFCDPVAYGTKDARGNPTPPAPGRASALEQWYRSRGFADTDDSRGRLLRTI